MYSEANAAAEAAIGKQEAESGSGGHAGGRMRVLVATGQVCSKCQMRCRCRRTTALGRAVCWSQCQYQTWRYCCFATDGRGRGAELVWRVPGRRRQKAQSTSVWDIAAHVQHVLRCNAAGECRGCAHPVSCLDPAWVTAAGSLQGDSLRRRRHAGRRGGAQTSRHPGGRVKCSSRLWSACRSVTAQLCIRNHFCRWRAG